MSDLSLPAQFSAAAAVCDAGQLSGSEKQDVKNARGVVSVPWLTPGSAGIAAESLSCSWKSRLYSQFCSATPEERRVLLKRAKNPCFSTDPFPD